MDRLLGNLVIACGLIFPAWPPHIALASQSPQATANRPGTAAASLPHQGGGLEPALAADIPGGKFLGGGFGARRSDWIEYTIDAPSGEVEVAIDYAFDQVQFESRFPRRRGPHTFSLALDGRRVEGNAVLVDTAGWRSFGRVIVPIGAPGEGRHVLRISPERDHQDVNLAWIAVVPKGTAEERPTASFLKEKVDRFRIRLTPHVDRDRLPVERIRENLKRQLAFHREFLGFDPERAAILTVVAQADWPDHAVAAWTDRGNVYLHEREVATPGGNYAHELFHYFEAGLDYPTWWSEGVAFVISMRSDVELYERRDQVDKKIGELQAWWDKEGRTQMVRDGANAVQWWGSERVPEDARGGLYRTTNLMMYRLWEQEGAPFFRRFYALIEADRRAGRYRMSGAPFDDQLRQIFDYAGRATDHDLTPFWRQWAINP